jgi:hypothetical protein
MSWQVEKMLEYNNQPWQPFKLKTKPGLADHGSQDAERMLFIKAEFQHDSYVLIVTDLKRVWREDVSTNQIHDKMKVRWL